MVVCYAIHYDRNNMGLWYEKSSRKSNSSWASDKDNLIAVASCVQVEMARKTYLDTHSEARDSVHKFTLIEYMSRAYLCLAGILPLFWCFVLNGPLCSHVFVTEERASMRQCGSFDFPRPLLSLSGPVLVCAVPFAFVCLLSRPSGRQAI